MKDDLSTEHLRVIEIDSCLRATPYEAEKNAGGNDDSRAKSGDTEPLKSDFLQEPFSVWGSLVRLPVEGTGHLLRKDARRVWHHPVI